MELTFSNPSVFKKDESITFKLTVIEFIKYLKSPQYIEQNETMTLGQKLQFTSKLLLFKLSLLPFLLPIIYFTKELTGAISIEHQKGWVMYFVLIVFAPVIEELIFRKILRFNLTAISIVVTILLYYIVKITIPKEFYIYAALGVIAMTPLYRWILGFFKSSLSLFWVKSFPFLFHIIAIGFGLIHLSNYSSINNYFLAIPLVTSQFVSGYVLGFVRMKFGMLFSIGLHSAWNFIASLALLVELIAKYF
jgi:uncharacterized protein